MTAGAHGQDDGGGTGDDVAAGPDPRFHGLAGLGVGHDVAPFIQVQARGALGEQRVGAGADGDDRGVDLHDEFGARDGHRPPPPGGVGLAQFLAQALHAGEPAVVIAQEAQRVGEQQELDALFLGVVDFRRHGRAARHGSAGR